MNKNKVNYIVKRNYSSKRTGTEAFVKLLKKDTQVPQTTRKNHIIECNQYNIDNDTNVCYTEPSFRDRCVVSKDSKED